MFTNLLEYSVVLLRLEIACTVTYKTSIAQKVVYMIDHVFVSKTIIINYCCIHTSFKVLRSNSTTEQQLLNRSTTVTVYLTLDYPNFSLLHR